ncbi:MAG: hypothetical protein Q7T15_09235 [Microcella sp.]|uniref:hypothetical protein n=1 Tax=Microcella sp. TaxID=1913979 RepID=UPI0027183283|nr:hypothetical protein [Microcella sp.]MDO8338421.1 hypothetical protein [Microcella sp.]
MSAFATMSTQAIELDLSGLTSVLAVILGIGVVILLVWMWRIGHQLETGIEPGAEQSAPPAAPVASTVGDEVRR